MKIIIDFGHPAHVHYFKNFVKIMKENGHKFSFIARDKEIAHQLLNHYQIPYKSRGKGAKSLLGKLLYIFYADYIIFRKALTFKPDLFLSFASTYAAHASWLVKKPHIALDDTEHAKFELMMYPPFSDVILNPSCFSKRFSEKQIFFNSYMELCYMHPNYFKPDPEIVKGYGVNPDEKYFVLRFVSWKASHDIGQAGLDLEYKKKIIEKLSPQGKILISSEGTLPQQFEKYRISINPVDLHHFLYFADLYIGEGSTTASECAVIGTPAIYINSLTVGYCKEQDEVYNACYHFKKPHGVLKKIDELLISDTLKIDHRKKAQQIINDKIDPTAFLVWFVENYPQSKKIMKENPSYQYKFRSNDGISPL